MITFSTVGDTERCVNTTVNRSGWPYVYLLLDTHEADQVELGFLYQGATFAPLNWKEVWNSQIVGEVPLNAVPVAAKGFNPRRPAQFDVGTTYSTGFLLSASGAYAVRPDTIGCAVRVQSATRATALCVYHHDSHYIKASVPYAGTRLAWKTATFVFHRNSREPEKSFWYVSGSSNTPGLRGTGKYQSLEDGVADLCSIVSEWWNTWESRVITTTMGGLRANYRLLPMAVNETPMDRQMVIAFLRQHHAWLKNAMRDAERSAIPTLHAKSFDQLEKFEGNFLVLLSKLDTFGQVTMKSFTDFMKSAGGAKDLASLWLANRYGDRLSVGGVSDLFRAIDREFLTIRPKGCRFLRGSSRVTVPFSDGMFNATFTFGSNIAVTPRDYNALMKLIRTAYEWDFYPSLANVWDAIPLSFVVDWIGNVGDIFASVDRMVQSHYYDVKAILQSARAEASDPVLPSVTHIYYERRLETSLQLGVEAVRLGLPSFVNLIDGLALICG